jgi:hypothetical protein
VVGGHVTNLHLTATGSGYTSAPTVTFPGAGSGSGASAQTGVQGRCCISIPKSGTYDVTCELPGAAPLSASVNALCNQDNNVSFAFPANTIGTFQGTFHYCDCSTTGLAAGVTVDITGDGSVTLTSDASGTVSTRLGAGSYSALITYPTGYTKTVPFTIIGCGGASVVLFVVGGLWVSICSQGNPSSTWDITVTRDDTGATIGTGSITLNHGSVLPNTEGATCIPISDVSGADTSITYHISGPSTFTAGGPVNCGSEAAPYPLLACN